MRKATLVIVGNIPQALGAVLAHHIISAWWMVEDPYGIKSPEGQGTCLTRVVVNGDRYSDYIKGWASEAPGTTLEPGTLLRVKWEQLAA